MTIISLLFLSPCSIFIASEICLQLFRCIGVQDIESLSSCGELLYSLSAYVTPWQFLSLPLFFRALTTSVLFCPTVLNIYENKKKFETTLLAASWKFPKPKPVYFKTDFAKTDHTSTHLCFSPLADHWFTNTVQTRFSASTRPFLVTWLNFYKPTRQLCSSSGTSILCLPSVLTLLLLLLVKTQIMPVEGMELYKVAVTNGHTWNPRGENLNQIDITSISLHSIVMPTVFLTLDTKTT